MLVLYSAFALTALPAFMYTIDRGHKPTVGLLGVVFCAVSVVYVVYQIVIGNTVGRIFSVVGLFLLIALMISIIRFLSR